MGTPQNVELEAAKFLHKLIQESTDEPVKLATKLYVILQHMKSSGKENSMPYQVISRAMETVINQHGLDIEVLKSSRLPLGGGTHMGDSSSSQFAGASPMVGVGKESKASLAENDMAKIDSHASNRPPVGPSSVGHNIYQGPVSHMSSKSFDHESPSSFDTRSTNSQSQERRETLNWEKANQKDGKKTSSKRKRADSSSATQPHVDNSQQLDTHNLNLRKGKVVNKVEPPGKLFVESGEHGQSNMMQSSGQMEHFPSISNSMTSALRAKQESQHLTEKLDSTNIVNSMPRALNSNYPEEIEVSSARNALGLQQAGSQSSTHDILSSRSIWNQNKIAPSFEKSQVSRFSSSAGFGNLTADMLLQQSPGSFSVSGTSSKVHGSMPGASGSYQHLEQGISAEGQFFSANRGEGASTTLAAGNSLEQGVSNTLANANKLVQGGVRNNVSEMGMLRSAVPRDAGKLPISHTPVSGMPFKEQHLKQLRAQCLVFLAFRNGLTPKKLHLEIALGNFFPREGGIADEPRKELIDHRGKEQSINDSNGTPEFTMPPERQNAGREIERIGPSASSTGIVRELNSLSKEAENHNLMEDANSLPSNLPAQAEERRHLLGARRNPESQMVTYETAESQAFLTKRSQLESLSVRGLTVSNPEGNLDNGCQPMGMSNQAPSVVGISKQMKPEMISWTGVGNHNEASKGMLPDSAILHESVHKNNAPSQSQSPVDFSVQGNRQADGHLPVFHWKPISDIDAEHHSGFSMKDGNMLSKHVTDDDSKLSEIQKRSIPDGCKMVPVDNSLKNGNHFTIPETDKEEEDTSVSLDLPSPKYTTSEKWIMDQQKRKLLTEQDWALKQRKTDQKIAACADKLKETVSSSEDISAKTKSVIELKKLQLLELQRRLRRDILNDFFKPVTSELDRLKSIKKHRIGRRSKQLERYEQKMKEERQKRIRERQKEFFSEIEIHKERLDDVFKMKRERWKGFNKYVREFHKRKERIHREKIDRIQREKINLLKINDVEGYLRMVQDAKSDRVKQLLKETEKYLQKLGSKLRDAKAMETHFETDMDVEKNETAVENEDETDQAKHYMESNEKYYLMAHSIKESISEQPTCLEGGKLREYQMNGLRWLVSLYNNHLNGILADEMGLGKTVQVIALICYLMETKNDRGPFLVVVPSSVLSGWESEINFWAPGVHKIVYSGPPEERRKLFKERIVHQKFNVLLTTYEYLMNKHDRPKLSKVHWHYIIIDEGHRIKNASCKLNADLKHYHSSHRLLLTGTPLQNNLEELWALLNFLLPNIFNSSEDFSQWFNKPFEGNGDNSADEALLSEEENLLIINRLHQVLRPFVLRRLKHKVENQLPEKIERLVRCEASAYQKLLMKRVEDNLGAIGSSKARSVHNSVMELRNICNHPYLSQLHVEEVHGLIPKHYLPNILRLCGKLEMLDRLLPKLKATGHRVLFFSTMTRLLDVMEDYLYWKQYRYLRLDGHTSGGERGALIDKFNQPGSPFFIFLLSIRAGGVGVNLQAADTVIIFDTDWNPQVDLQAQARAHRIGQKKDVLVLRLETVQTVEEQVRASAEHKLGVANQSITAGFFDNNTSAEDRREYLESLLRECKKEEIAPVLDDDALNDLIARSESEIDIFESVDKKRREEEMATWKKLVSGQGEGSEPVPPLPSRLLTDDDLKPFYEAMKIYEVSNSGMASNVAGVKRKGGSLGGLDTQHYGRGKRAREVRSYEEQWTEEEFEKMCQVDSPESPKIKEEVPENNVPTVVSGSNEVIGKAEMPAEMPAQMPAEMPAEMPAQMPAEMPIQMPALPNIPPPQPSVELPMQQSKMVTPPSKRGRGRPKKAAAENSLSPVVPPTPAGIGKMDIGSQSETISSCPMPLDPDSLPGSTVKGVTGTICQLGVWIAPSTQPTPSHPSLGISSNSSAVSSPIIPVQIKGQSQKSQSGEKAPRRRGKKQGMGSATIPVLPAPGTGEVEMDSQRGTVSSSSVASGPESQSGEKVPRRRGKKQCLMSPTVSVIPTPGAGQADMSSQRGNISTSSTVTGHGSASGPITGTPVLPASSATSKLDAESNVPAEAAKELLDSRQCSKGNSDVVDLLQRTVPSVVPASPACGSVEPDMGLRRATVPVSSVVSGVKPQSKEKAPRRRGKKQVIISPAVPVLAPGSGPGHTGLQREDIPSFPTVSCADSVSGAATNVVITEQSQVLHVAPVLTASSLGGVEREFPAENAEKMIDSTVLAASSVTNLVDVEREVPAESTKKMVDSRVLPESSVTSILAVECEFPAETTEKMVDSRQPGQTDNSSENQYGNADAKEDKNIVHVLGDELVSSVCEGTDDRGLEEKAILILSSSETASQVLDIPGENSTIQSDTEMGAEVQETKDCVVGEALVSKPEVAKSQGSANTALQREDVSSFPIASCPDTVSGANTNVVITEQSSVPHIAPVLVASSVISPVDVESKLPSEDGKTEASVDISTDKIENEYGNPDAKENESIVPVLDSMLVSGREGTDKRSSEEKAILTLPSTETASQILDIPDENSKCQSGMGMSAEVVENRDKENKENVVDEALVSKPELAKKQGPANTGLQSEDMTGFPIASCPDSVSSITTNVASTEQSPVSHVAPVLFASPITNLLDVQRELPAETTEKMVDLIQPGTVEASVVDISADKSENEYRNADAKEKENVVPVLGDTLVSGCEGTMDLSLEEKAENEYRNADAKEKENVVRVLGDTLVSGCEGTVDQSLEEKVENGYRNVDAKEKESVFPVLGDTLVSGCEGTVDQSLEEKAENEYRNADAKEKENVVPVLGDTLVSGCEGTVDQSLEEKAFLTLPSSETSSQVLDISDEKSISHSNMEIGIEVEENRDQVVDAAFVSKPEVAKCQGPTNTGLQGGDVSSLPTTFHHDSVLDNTYVASIEKRMVSHVAPVLPASSVTSLLNVECELPAETTEKMVDLGQPDKTEASVVDISEDKPDNQCGNVDTNENEIIVPILDGTLVSECEHTENQSLEEKASLTLTSSETSNQVLDIPVENSSELGGAMGANVQENKAHAFDVPLEPEVTEDQSLEGKALSTLSNSGVEAPVLDLGIGKPESQSGRNEDGEAERVDHALDEEAPVSKPDITESETLEEKVASPLSNLESETAPVMELPVEKSESQSTVGTDEKVLEYKDSATCGICVSDPQVTENQTSEGKTISTLSSLEKPAPVLNLQLDKSEDHSFDGSIPLEHKVTEDQSLEANLCSSLEAAAQVMEAPSETCEGTSGREPKEEGREKEGPADNEVLASGTQATENPNLEEKWSSKSSTQETEPQ